MSGTPDREVARYWGGLSLLVRLSQAGTELSSEEVGALLGTRNVKGIGAALSGTRGTLRGAGIRMEEAAIRRTVRGRSVWTGGPRIRQAMHVLEQERYRWTVGSGPAIENVRPGETGPVLVLRALKSRGNVYRIDGGMAELDEILDDDLFEIGDARSETFGETFVARIEPGEDGREHPVPDGYGENGIWVRGEHDYDDSRVPGAIGTGLWSTMIAWVGEATWGRTPASVRGRAAAGGDGERGQQLVDFQGRDRALAGRRAGVVFSLCELDWRARPGRTAACASSAHAIALLVRGRDLDGDGQTHRSARGRAARRRHAYDKPGDRASAQAARQGSERTGGGPRVPDGKEAAQADASGPIGGRMKPGSGRWTSSCPASKAVRRAQPPLGRCFYKDRR